jgi:sulfide:quinone oxidoreductase
MARIVILGAGIGGLPAAYEIRQRLGRSHAITVINERDYFQFVPSNPWVAVGRRTRKDITIPLRPYLERRKIDFVAKAARRVEPEGNRVVLDDGSSVDYDYLVITTGPKLAFDEVPGAGPERYTQSICTVDHAERAHKDFETLLEHPGPVVVGAFPGASCFGPAYEYAMILDTLLRKRRLRSKVPMTFVTPEPYVGHLGLDGVGDSKGIMEHEFREHDIRWITNARTVGVEAGKMHVEELDVQGSVVRKHELPFAHAMMIPAFKGVDAVAGVEGLSNPRGFTLVDARQRNTKYPNIYSAGVCIAIPPVGPTPVPCGVPKTGFMIESMVSAISRNLEEELSGAEPSHKGTWQAICLADFGWNGAAFAAVPQIPPRDLNWFGDGVWVHFAKVAFEKYFLRKMKKGSSEPIYEKYLLRLIGFERLQQRVVRPQRSA